MRTKLQKQSGVIVLFLVATIPMLLWLGKVGLGSVTTDFGTMVASLGKAVALSGIALYAILPLLSMRHHWIEVLFGGLDKLYRLHGKAGKIAFLLIVLHPMLLGLGRYISGASVGSVWDWSSFVVLVGIVALLGMVVVTAVTIYSHIRHQQWIWVHRVFGWLIPVFFAHALFARAQITQNRPLLIYMIAIGLIGFGAFLYRSVLSRWLVHKHRYEVSEVNHLTDDVVELVLKPTRIPLSFTPGQFAFLSFVSPHVDEEAHPYSFSNANNGPYVRFTIKALGDYTKQLKRIEPGTVARLEGPYGTFSYKRVKNRKQVWIAGGIGITPFLSMARSFSGKQVYDIRFFYGTQTLDDAVFLQEFLDITRHVPETFSMSVVSQDISGFVTVDLLSKSIQNLSEFDYLIVGPPPMMKALREQLTKAGVPPGQIHIESFSM